MAKRHTLFLLVAQTQASGGRRRVGLWNVVKQAINNDIPKRTKRQPER